MDLRPGKAGAILACAALSQSFRVSRANLATLLWSDTTDQRARSSLRQAIARLRRDAPAALEDFVNFEGPDVSLKLDRGAVAHLRLLDEVRAGRVDAESFADVRVPTGFCTSILDLTEEMDRFVLQERAIYFDDLQAALGDVLVAQDGEARCEAARVLKRLDATNETARRAIMRHLVDSGEVAAAIREFEDLQALLDTEFDVDPSPETLELHADIKMGRLAPAPVPSFNGTAGSGGGTARLPLIRVARAEPGGGGSEANAFFADLVAMLVRFREWSVADSRFDTGADADFALNVEVVDGGGVPVAVVLLRDERTGRFVWSENLELSFANWRRNHLEIVQHIASAIELTISRSRLAEMENWFPSKSTSFDLWLYSRDLVSIWRPERFDRAIEIMRSIVDIDPKFAPAHMELAALYNSQHLFRPGAPMSAAIMSDAARFAENAVRLDPLDGKSQRVLGYSELMNHRFEKAHFHLSRAVELNSADALTLISAALGLMFCGDREAADEATAAALSIRPEMPSFLIGYRATMQVLARRYEEAVATVESAPDGIMNLRGWEAIALWMLGRDAEAAEAATAFVKVTSENWCGATTVTPHLVCDWFQAAFPIRETRKKAALVAALRAAVAAGADAGRVSSTG